MHLPILHRSYPMMLPEKLVQIAGVYIPHPAGYLLDAHTAACQQFLYPLQTALGYIEPEIFPKITFEKTPYVGR